MPHGVSHTTQTATRETEAKMQWARTCPLCEFEAAHPRGIYVHLQTSHRKSALATALLETSASPE